jgi:hypothetical protein
MSTTWNRNDVEPVTALELCLQMQVAQAAGIRFSPSHPLSEADISQMERTFWQSHRGSWNRGHAIFSRAYCLSLILGARRIRDLLATHGDLTIKVACEFAASMPLNVKWGFNKHKLINAVRMTLADTAPTSTECASLTAP